MENGGIPLVNYYGSSMVLILMDMYPLHPWKLQKFQFLSEGYWKDTKYQVDLNMQSFNPSVSFLKTQQKSWELKTGMNGKK